jgi:hypothetical protein
MSNKVAYNAFSIFQGLIFGFNKWAAAIGAS